MYLLEEYFKGEYKKLKKRKEDIRVIRDPIYGFIEIPPSIIGIIDDSLVQRLRWITQLPLEQLVYPSALHSRFEHSLGTMHLAVLSAIAIISDDPSWNILVKDYKESVGEDKPKDIKRYFIISAAVVGLLHDLGHGPFSHTLETAVNKFVRGKDFYFHHEKLGYLLAEIILNDRELLPAKYSHLVEPILKALNKDIRREELEKFPLILRELIDNPIDVDKGDYLLRDSYHCGVKYGVYDYSRLWRFMRLTEGYDGFKLAIHEKGALEAWSLKIARYRMYKNVYLHHVRLITDALLSEIIADTLENVQEPPEHILPLKNVKRINTLDHKNISKILYWTEHEFLKTLSTFEDSEGTSINKRLEDFFSRKLYKRCGRITHSELGIPLTGENQTIVSQKLREFFKEKQSRGEFYTFMIYKEEIPPVFDRDTQSSIRIMIDGPKRKTLSLAEFLGIQREKYIRDYNYDIENFDEGNIIIEIFKRPPLPKKNRKKYCKNILNETAEFLKSIIE